MDSISLSNVISLKDGVGTNWALRRLEVYTCQAYHSEVCMWLV